MRLHFATTSETVRRRVRSEIHLGAKRREREVRFELLLYSALICASITFRADAYQEANIDQICNLKIGQIIIYLYD